MKHNLIRSTIALALILGAFTIYTPAAFAACPVFATTAEATTAASAIGYVKINETSNGQAVYKKGSDYISRDIDCHNGGAWKRANSVANLGSKTTRLGTYNANLTVRVGD